MTEWLRDGLEGHSLKAILCLYIFGVIVLSPVVALIGLLFGAQMALQVTPLLVIILGGIEYGICYLYPLLRYGRNDAALSNEHVRAAEALGERKDTRAVESLIAALKDEDSDVRWGAARALDLLGGVNGTRGVESFSKRYKS